MADAAIEIGEFRLDAAGGVLRRSGEVVPVRAKTFAFLCHLAHNRGRVISKDELLQAVWPGLFVSEDSLTQCVSELRKVLGTGAEAMLRTVPKRGYLLASEAAVPAAGLPEQVFPSIAILPFRNRGPDNTDDALIDAMVDEITYGLARFKTITVIARNSAFSFPASSRPPLKEISEMLGAEFIVEGSALRADGRLLASVTLTHAPTGQRIWGSQFDFAEADLFSMNAEIAVTIISRLVSNIDQGVQQTAKPGTSNLAAFENFARGVAFLRTYGPGVNERARDHFLKAIALDPDCAVAHAYLALADVIIADYGASPRPALEAARDRVNLAIALEPEEARCHRIMGLVRLYLREHEAAERCLHRAYDINPYDADTLVQLGFVIAMRGRPAEGLAWMDKAITLNPFRPYWYDLDRAYTLYMLGCYDEARKTMLGTELGPFHSLWLAACCAMCGRPSEATDALARFLETADASDILDQAQKWTEFEHEEDLEHLRVGLRLAMTEPSPEPP
ncbi:winged helix-turn-helix domain-containing protein [Rhizobium sp. TH2]|uniref:winged helix-turn-helix domain-containing tetratricopeptide repeat protein n=1 Tax=Rhizobium sp. TH2 TaxID=2775403 RepID=UPI0021571797|nr:winged helix-turn-helix domain-containing protein [Rhizobium sp. TH2]UVC09279.1 winged helix-turn-helix domain-containing protein [Rhizobium sp. TH2]